MKTLRKLSLGAIVLFLPILAAAQNVVGPNPSNDVSGTNGGFTLQNPLGNINTLGDFLNLVLYNIVLPIGSIVVVLMIIYTGFLFVTARGDSGQIEDARHMLLYVVIGAAILFGATAISAIVSGTLCQLAPGIPGCFMGPPAPPGL